MRIHEPAASWPRPPTMEGIPGCVQGQCLFFLSRFCVLAPCLEASAAAISGAAAVLALVGGLASTVHQLLALVAAGGSCGGRLSGGLYSGALRGLYSGGFRGLYSRGFGGPYTRGFGRLEGGLAGWDGGLYGADALQGSQGVEHIGCLEPRRGLC